MNKKHSESKPNRGGEPAGLNQPHAGLRKQSENGSTSSDQEHGQRIRDLLSRQELAARWGVCAHTEAQRKDLRPVRLGPRLLRYRLAEVEAIESAAAA